MPKEARSRSGHLSANPQPSRNLMVLRRHGLRAIRVRARALAEFRSTMRVGATQRWTSCTNGGEGSIQLTLTRPPASWVFIKGIQTGKRKAHPISRSGPSAQEERHSLRYPLKSGLCPYVG